MPLSSNRGYTLSTQLFTADIDLDHLDKVCLSGFFTEQLLLFFSHPLPLLSFLGGSHYLGSPFQEAAHIWGKRSHAQSPQGQHPPKLFGSLLHRRFAYSPNVMHFYQYFYAGSFYFLQIQEPYWCFWEPRNILLQLLRCMKLPKHQRVGKKPMIIFFYCGYILTKDLGNTQNRRTSRALLLGADHYSHSIYFFFILCIICTQIILCNFVSYLLPPFFFFAYHIKNISPTLLCRLHNHIFFQQLLNIPSCGPWCPPPPPNYSYMPGIQSVFRNYLLNE